MPLNAEVHTEYFTSKEQKVFDDIRGESNNLKEAITNITPQELISIIKKIFTDKNNGNWLPYASNNPGEPSIKTSPAYTFIVQMTLDLLNVDDDSLKGSCGIDGKYGNTTIALVKQLQAKRKIKQDGLAGKDFFEHALRELQQNDTLIPSGNRVSSGQTPPPPPPAPRNNEKVTVDPGDIETKEKLKPGEFYQIYPDNGHKAHADSTASAKLKSQLSTLINAKIRNNIVTVNFGAGTDTTPPRIRTIAKNSTYIQKREAVIKELNAYTTISAGNKTALETYIRATDFGTNRTSEGFQNNRLLGLRNLEVVRQAIKAFASRDTKNKNIELILYYDPKLDQAGGDRFVKGSVTGESREEPVPPEPTPPIYLLYNRINGATLQGTNDGISTAVNSSETNELKKDNRNLINERILVPNITSKTIEIGYSNLNFQMRYHWDTGKAEIKYGTISYEIPINFGLLRLDPSTSYPDGTKWDNHMLVRRLGYISAILATLQKNGIKQRKNIPLEYDLSTKDINLMTVGTIIEDELTQGEGSFFIKTTDVERKSIIAMCNQIKLDAGMLTASNYGTLDPAQKHTAYTGTKGTY